MVHFISGSRAAKFKRSIEHTWPFPGPFPNCKLRMSECRNWPKPAFPWQELVSFAQMLINELSRDIQIDREPLLG